MFSQSKLSLCSLLRARSCQVLPESTHLAPSAPFYERVRLPGRLVSQLCYHPNWMCCLRTVSLSFQNILESARMDLPEAKGHVTPLLKNLQWLIPTQVKAQTAKPGIGPFLSFHSPLQRVPTARYSVLSCC